MKTFREFIELSNINESRKQYIGTHVQAREDIEQALRDLGFKYSSIGSSSGKILHGVSIGGGGSGWVHPIKPDMYLTLSDGRVHRVAVIQNGKELYSGKANSSSNSFFKTYNLRLNMAVRKILG